MQISFVLLWKNMGTNHPPKKPNTQTKTKKPNQKPHKKRKWDQKKIFNENIIPKKRYMLFRKRKAYKFNSCKDQRKSFSQPSGNSNL